MKQLKWLFGILVLVVVPLVMILVSGVVNNRATIGVVGLAYIALITLPWIFYTLNKKPKGDKPEV